MKTISTQTQQYENVAEEPKTVDEFHNKKAETTFIDSVTACIA